MLARRVISLSPDKAFAKQMGTALKAAGGAVEIHTSLDGIGRGEIQAALIAVHIEGELSDAIAQLAPRLAGDGRIVAVVPRADLARVVTLMQQSDRVAGVLTAEHWRSQDLSSVATRILAGDIFGLEKLVPWGTKIYSSLVGDYQEKSLCIAQVSEFAELMSVRRKYREAIEQVVDEMLMNALYDAPVDEAGKQVFAEIPTKTRISLRMEQKVVVQFACDDKTFSVSVRDSFGTLDRNTVLRYLDKCLHSSEQIDRKTGGAGLGLYLMANSSTRMFFNVLPGIATEAVCTFDLDSPKVALTKFGFFQERIDAAGRLAAGPSRLLPAGISHPVERRAREAPPPPRAPATVIAALSAAIVLLLVLIGLVAYPRLKSHPTARLTVVTEPGSTIEIEGRVRGVADDGTLVVDGLEAGRPYRVKALHGGFRAAETVAQVESDRVARVELPLTPETASVTFRSDPDGATVIVDGKELGKTPLTVTSLAPRAQITAVLRRPGYVDDALTLTVPGPGGEATVDHDLQFSPDVASLVITSDPPGAAVFVDDQRLVGVVTPSDELLVEAGAAHTVAMKLPGYLPARVKVTPGRGARAVPVTATLVAGVGVTVSANLDARVTIDGVPGCKRRTAPVTCPAPKGRYQIKLEGTTKMPFRVTRDIEVDGDEVEAAFELGVVEAPAGWKLVLPGEIHSRIAIETGRRKVTLKQPEGGASVTIEVRAVAGKVTRIATDDLVAP
ncbi:MAG: PEGA domain-containing protein [Kofleriaceae bacterium]|nr:PEGA domain-containing protein [Kofleriaceae bacterium]MCB9573417.1 PEGA domain-containing protein [Kofleriaceae bacterium]